MSLHLLLPSGYAERPSGGNVYGRRLRAGLAGLGHDVETHEVDGPAAVAALLPTLPDDAVVLVDGLVGTHSADRLRQEAARLRLVLLLHMEPATEAERALVAAAATVVVTSDWTRSRLADADRVHVAVPGVDMADLAPGTEGGGELLCVAAVTPAKGHEVLLDALARLTDLDWRCTLVGALDLDADLVDGLRKTTAETGIADRVGFVGALAHDEVRAAYARSDVLVLPTLAESYGMVVTEALAHGLPVIASAVGGVPEALGRAEDGSVPGLLVRPGDPAALAAALRRWLEEPRRRRRLRRSARLRRLTLPTWSQTTARVAVALEAAR